MSEPQASGTIQSVRDIFVRRSAAQIFTVHAPSGARYPVSSARAGEPAGLAAGLESTALESAPSGFSWAAFLFGPLWLAAKGLWLRAAAVAAALFALGGAVGAGSLHPLAQTAAVLALAVYVGLEGREWARGRLMRRGRAIVDVAVAADALEAEALALRRMAMRPMGETAREPAGEPAGEPA